MSANLVTIRNLCVHLGGNPVLQHLDADLARHRITALIGLNGSGKTTLLRALLKEIPYSGTIQFHCGHDHQHPMPKHVGYVPQKLQIEANLPLTVRDLLALALERRPLFLGVSRRLEAMFVVLLDRVGAPRQLLDRPVEKISGGELQRVLLGLALQPEPELLLLDEPAAGIDFHDQVRFYDLLSQLNRERQVTILLVSHDVGMVSKKAHHVLCLRDGSIQCQGSTHDIAQMLADTFGSAKALFEHEHSH